MKQLLLARAELYIPSIRVPGRIRRDFRSFTFLRSEGIYWKTKRIHNMTEIFKDKPILLGVTGGIAAYKAAALASRLTQAGAVVDVVMTEGATRFIAPLTFASLTHRKVNLDIWDEDRRPGHIALAERPVLIVVAPATANTMAKLAMGMADNLLTAALLATNKPILLAPAMNRGMWEAASTRRNLETLRRDGCRFVGPNAGNLACGDVGVGRMAEPAEIIEAMAKVLKEITHNNSC
jgi:phosphopantothenoylcysteine decarboxylase/phosphopantothenate--cysteine ligase